MKQRGHLEETRKILRSLVDKGYLEMSATKKGEPIYRFTRKGRKAARKAAKEQGDLEIIFRTVGEEELSKD